jgi:hypothetical protein
MAKKPETNLKERVLKRIKELPYTWVYKTNDVSRRGIPDILLCVRGNFIAIELKKSEKDYPDPLQEHNLTRIGASGGVALVCHPKNLDAIMVLLSDIAHRVALVDIEGAIQKYTQTEGILQ